MTPKEHFCHSRLVVPAQTSKAREGTHHLLVVRFLKEGSTGPPSPPPNSMVFSKPSGDPTYQTSPPCTREERSKTTTRNRKCVMIVSCMFHVSQKPTSFVGDSAEFPVSCHLCHHLIERQRRLLHWTVHLNGGSGMDKYENESKGQNGRKALWNHIMKSTVFQLTSPKPLAENFVSKSQISSMFGYSNKNCEITWVKPLRWDQGRPWNDSSTSEESCPVFMSIPTKDAPGVSFTGSFVHFFDGNHTESRRHSDSATER